MRVARIPDRAGRDTDETVFGSLCHFVEVAYD